MDQKPTGLSSGNDQNIITESGNIHVGNGPPLPPPSPQAPWQSHHMRVPWGRPPPIPREGEPPTVCPGLPPINMPPPQIRPRGLVDGNRSPTQNAALEQSSMNVEYNQMPPYTTKPPPYNAHPLMQSICNPPPPPPPHHQQPRPHPSQTVQHYQVPISQTYQVPTSCPPWMN